LMLWIFEFKPSVTALVMWCRKYVSKFSNPYFPNKLHKQELATYNKAP